ncbi:MAG: hypothetical protein ACFFBH_09115 [Promethearchaeota archaeon]
MKKRLIILLLSVVLFLIILQSSVVINGRSKSQISGDNDIRTVKSSSSDCGIAICDYNGSQWNPKICSSGAGNAIIIWCDHRSGSDTDLYAQKIDLDGNADWQTNGIMIFNSTKENLNLETCSDGMGGVIMTWNQVVLVTESAIYAQRIDSNGNIVWNPSGALILFSDTFNLFTPHLCSDETGGAIVTWFNEDNNSIQAQRIDMNGDLLWGSSGITVRSINASEPMICSDGFGGAIISWEDSRHYNMNYQDIYAQRIDSNGNLMWDTNGVAICTTTDSQAYPKICSDNAGGAIITWEDSRNGLYAQRVDSDGNCLWDNNGSCISEFNGWDISIQPDGQNGAVFGFDTYVDITPTIGAQRIDSNGNRLWGINGTTLYSGEYGENNCEYPQICSNQGGAIITWQIYNYNTHTIDIYVQKVTSGGNILWQSNGVPICIYASDLRDPFPQICNDGFGGAYITWRHDINLASDIRAQHITSDGHFPWTEPSIPFGNVHFLWIIISVLSLILFIKRKRVKYFNPK